MIRIQKKQPILFLTLLHFLLIVDCSAQPAHELRIADQVFPTKTEKHSIYPTTQLWIAVPEGFSLQRPRPWYQKGRNNILKITDGWKLGYTYLKNDYLGKYDDAVAQNVRPKYFYRKEFRLGNQPAFLDYYKLSVNDHLEFLKMIIGTDNRATIVECEFTAGDTTTRNALVKSLLSIVVDESIHAGPGELIDYTIDTSNSNLRFTHSLGGAVFIYSVRPMAGNADPDLENAVTLSPYSYPLDSVAMQKEAMKWVEDVKRTYRGGVTSNIYGKSVKVNGLDGYELLFQLHAEGKMFTILTLIAGDDKNSIVLSSKLPAKGEMTSEVRRVFYSLRKRQ